MSSEDAIPEAIVKTGGSRLNRVAMAVVLACVITTACWLYARAWHNQGLLITIRFPEAHGLKVGDPVKLHDVTVGVVRKVTITEDLSGIMVTVSLTGPLASRDRIAREDSAFWIVRPDISLTQIRGSETIIGANYIDVEPGRGEPASHFVGLARAPVVERRLSGDLEVTLVSDKAGGAGAGAPILYRGIAVGRILDVDLAPNGNEVLTRVLIRMPYNALIREQTRFFVLNAVQFDMGIRGVTLAAGSLESILKGGIGFATPGPGQQGDPAVPGQRFALYPEPEEKWLAWEPSLNLTAVPQFSTPHPLPCHISWGPGNRFAKLYRADGARSGVVLPTVAGLLGLEDLFWPNKKWDEPFVLEVGNTFVPSDSRHIWEGNGLTLLDIGRPLGSGWPRGAYRCPDKVEDVIIYRTADDSSFVPASKLQTGQSQWKLTDGKLGASWHGAPVIAASDKKLVGILRVDDKTVFVALLPEDFPLFQK